MLGGREVDRVLIRVVSLASATILLRSKILTKLLEDCFAELGAQPMGCGWVLRHGSVGRDHRQKL